MENNIRRLVIVREKDDPTDGELFLSMYKLLKRWVDFVTTRSGNLGELIADTKAIVGSTTKRLDEIEKDKAAHGRVH